MPVNPTHDPMTGLVYCPSCGSEPYTPLQIGDACEACGYRYEDPEDASFTDAFADVVGNMISEVQAPA